ncbi:MAG: extracellular solute-binding protein [Actinobacteria bacterium]|nr:extracellular solute-binding protein [Actinomycetota bacterium]MCL5771410.1 extracellular solute-binding protein [Actinomycetota bacterium]
MKKILIIVLVVIIAISMLFIGISCKKTTSVETTAKAEETTTQAISAETTVAETTAAETTSAEPITISWWDLQTAPEYKAMLDEVFALYQKDHSNVSFDRKGQPAGDYAELLKSATLAGDLPDIYSMWMTDFNTLYKEGNVLNLKPYVDADPNWKKALEMFPLNDPVVSIDNGNVLCAVSSQSWHLYMIYYKDLSDQYKLKEPTTVDIVVENNEILKANGITSFATGFQYPGFMIDLWVTFVAMIDGDTSKVHQAEKGEISWQNESFLTALKAFQKLIPCFSKDALSVEDTTDGHTRFYSKKYWGMLQGYEQMFTELGTQKAEDVKNNNVVISAWPLPVEGANNQVMAGGPGADFTVNAKSKHIDEVINFLKFFATDDVSKILLKYSIPPAVNYNFDASEIVKDPIFLNAMQVVKSHPKQYVTLFFYNPDAYSRLMDNMTKMFSGSMAPEKVLEDMDSLTYKK